MLAEKIDIEIFGRIYEVNTEGLTPIEASALAQFVTERMQEIQKQSRIVDTSKLAVLTALNIADELIRLKKKQQETEELVLKRLQGMKKILESMAEKN